MKPAGDRRKSSSILLSPRLWTLLALAWCLVIIGVFMLRVVSHGAWLRHASEHHREVRQVRLDLDDAIRQITGACFETQPCDRHLGEALLWSALERLSKASAGLEEAQVILAGQQETAAGIRQILIANPDEFVDQPEALRELLRACGGLQKSAAQINGLWGDLIRNRLAMQQRELLALLGIGLIILAPIGAALLLSDRAHRRSARALALSNARWEYALETLGGGLLLWDIPSNRQQWSPRLKAMLGYAPDEIDASQEEWIARIHPEDAAAALEAMDSHLRGLTPAYECEYRVRCRDGAYKWFLDRGKVMDRSPDGKALYMIGTPQDITAQKSREEATAREADLRRILFEQSQDGIVILNEDGGVYELNPRFAEMLGYSPEEARAMHVWDWDPIMAPDEILRRVVSDPSITFESIHQRKNGSRYNVEIGSSSVTWDQKILRICVCRDISERKKIEEELRASEDRLKLALRATNMGVWEWSVAANTIYWSDEIAEILGFREFQATPDRILQAIHPEDAENVIRRFQDSLEYDTPFEFEYRIVREDDSVRWVSTVGRLVYEEEGRLARAVGTVQDITRRKEADQALRESELRFATIFKGTPVSIAITRLADGRILDVNPAFEQYSGYPRDELLGHSVADLGGWLDLDDR